MLTCITMAPSAPGDLGRSLLLGHTTAAQVRPGMAVPFDLLTEHPAAPASCTQTAACLPSIRPGQHAFAPGAFDVRSVRCPRCMATHAQLSPPLPPPPQGIWSTI
jgi:hypothetical protein